MNAWCHKGAYSCWTSNIGRQGLDTYVANVFALEIRGIVDSEGGTGTAKAQQRDKTTYGNHCRALKSG